MFRTAERRISDKEVEEVVRTGAVIQTNQRGLHGGLKRLYKKFVQGRVVVVVAEIHKEDCWVITLMPKKIKFKVNVAKGCVPVVEVDTVAQALYVYFQRGVKVARTVVQSQWPLVAVDLDRSGAVIGVEACGIGEFTLSPLLDKARVEVPARLLNSARYLPTPVPVGAGK